MLEPVFSLTLWQWLLVATLCTQATILSVTIYLHRSQAHRALDVHPALAHAIRLWLWLTTGMSTLQWVAVHRKHHAKVETAEDPHSPQVHGLRTVLFKGVALYRKAANDPATIERYGRGAPSDWLEHNLYLRHGSLGLVITTVANILLFGWMAGLALSATMFLWIPVWAAGVINGVGHAKGYRNFASPDASRNLLPWGFFIGGEELHNNHHAHPTSAKLSYQPWEFDIGWLAIRVLEVLGLAKVKKAVTRPRLERSPQACTQELLRTLVAHRLVVGRWFDEAVSARMRELRRQGAVSREQARALRAVFGRMLTGETLSPQELELVEAHPVLGSMARAWLELQTVWTRQAARPEEMRQALQTWFERIETSGTEALRSIAHRMQRVQPVPA